jgi:RimJ/RimL family protein N-acetyltransferase
MPISLKTLAKMEHYSIVAGPSGPQGTHQLQHTPSGSPYIALSTASSTAIYLTQFYSTDINRVQETVSIPEVYLHLIAVPQPYTLADAEWWINHQVTGKSNLPLQVLRSDDPETGKFIGSVSLMPPDSEALARVRDKMPGCGPAENEFELGYYLHPDARGKGIMRSAVKALLDWGTNHCEVKTVVVRISEDNLASRRVVEGMKEFVREGANDDWVDWPEEKGGGRRKVLVWRWRV